MPDCDNVKGVTIILIAHKESKIGNVNGFRLQRSISMRRARDRSPALSSPGYGSA